jgi:hypothetical protein
MSRKIAILSAMLPKRHKGSCDFISIASKEKQGKLHFWELCFQRGTKKLLLSKSCHKQVRGEAFSERCAARA